MPRNPIQKKEVQVPTVPGRVPIPDPSDTLGDPVLEKKMMKLVEAAGRFVANRNVPGSGMTAPSGTNDDTGRVELVSEELVKKTEAATMKQSAKTSTMKIREMPLKTYNSKTASRESRRRTCEHVLIDQLGVQQ